MNVYVETNFVLEIAASQEQAESCLELIRLARTGAIVLVVPGFSLMEPHQTLERRRQDRKRLSEELAQHRTQLSRSARYQNDLHVLASVSDVLIRSAEDDRRGMTETRGQLLEHAAIVPLNAQILIAASAIERDLGISAEDAAVLASVLDHLTSSSPAEACFVTRNSKDFDDPDIAARLHLLDCRLLFNFRDCLDFVRSRLRPDAG